MSNKSIVVKRRLQIEQRDKRVRKLRTTNKK